MVDNSRRIIDKDQLIDNVCEFEVDTMNGLGEDDF